MARVTVLLVLAPVRTLNLKKAAPPTVLVTAPHAVIGKRSGTGKKLQFEGMPGQWLPLQSRVTRTSAVSWRGWKRLLLADVLA